LADSDNTHIAVFHNFLAESPIQRRTYPSYDDA